MATPTTATPAGSPSTPDQPFDTVLRGYERRQVDDYVGRLKDEITQLKDDLAEAQRKRRLANEHAEATEREMRDLRAKSAHSEPRSVEDSFGYRAEKLLRIAEQEAAEVRTHASRESAAIIEQARTEAEKHRHEVEQSLIARAAVLEQQAAQRNAELQEREQQISDQLSAAREQADQLHAAAARTADRLRQESEAAAEEAKLRAATDIQRQRDQAAQEIARLDKVQADVRSELARLNDVLSNELAAGSRGMPAQRNGQSAPANGGTARATTGGRGRTPRDARSRSARGADRRDRRSRDAVRLPGRSSRRGHAHGRSVPWRWPRPDCCRATVARSCAQHAWTPLPTAAAPHSSASGGAGRDPRHRGDAPPGRRAATVRHDSMVVADDTVALYGARDLGAIGRRRTARLPDQLGRAARRDRPAAVRARSAAR